jgi:hypothetical protein
MIEGALRHSMYAAVAYRRQRFTAEEAEFFESIVRPSAQSGKNTTTERALRLHAQKPFT